MAKNELALPSTATQLTRPKARAGRIEVKIQNHPLVRIGSISRTG